MAKELAKKLINAGAHFGHGASRWNPKMKPYIYSKRGKIHVIDIKETLKGVILAKKLIVDVVSSGRDVIFVGTKRQAQSAVTKHARSCSMHYVAQRWLGGILTNFRTIRSRLARLEELEAMAESGTLEKESKKQASRLKREMRKIKGNLDGVRKMSQMPGVVVAIDAKKEYIALREARKLGIPTIAILDTDSDPDTVDIAIPANDDSIRAIDIILGELADAVAVARTMAPAQKAQAARPRRARSSRSAIARAKDKPATPEPTPAAAAVVTPEPAQTGQAAPDEDKPQQ